VSTETLTDRLRRAIQTRRALAEQASGPNWTVTVRHVQTPDGGGAELATLRDSDHGEDLVTVQFGQPGLRDDDLHHAAANDPQQILKDCDAHLKILDKVLSDVEHLDSVVEGEFGGHSDVAGLLVKTLAEAYGLAEGDG
jgi:hypothetical protein